MGRSSNRRGDIRDMEEVSMEKHEILCGKECKGNSIDQQVDEKKAELQRIYDRFNLGKDCICPLCKAMKEHIYKWKHIEERLRWRSM